MDPFANLAMSPAQLVLNTKITCFVPPVENLIRDFIKGTAKSVQILIINIKQLAIQTVPTA
jgi:hypothetical protein